MTAGRGRPAGERRVILFARAPLPGQAKTRLSPPLAPEAAARLAGAFLQDSAALAATLPGARLTVAFTPAEAAPLMARLLPPGTPLEDQGPGDLGARLLRAFARACAGGAPAAILGTDTPDLPPGRLEEALRLLEAAAADLVLGPASDGGYYLIAARAPHPELFREIPWSTERVLRTTLERAAAAGLRARLLAPWNDVDTAADLERLRARLAAAPPAAAPRSRALLDALALTDRSRGSGSPPPRG